MGIKWITPEWIPPEGNLSRVKALTTCRQGGVSLPPYEGLNLGTQVGDCPLAVEKNRHLLSVSCRLPNDPVWIQQVHGTRVIDAAAAMQEKIPREADASFTQEKGVVCAVLTADC